MKAPSSPFLVSVAKLPGGPYYTVVQVAEKLEVSPQTLRGWFKRYKACPKPAKRQKFGKSSVRLWTDEEIQQLAVWAQTRDRRFREQRQAEVAAKTAAFWEGQRRMGD